MFAPGESARHGFRLTQPIGTKSPPKASARPGKARLLSSLSQSINTSLSLPAFTPKAQAPSGCAGSEREGDGYDASTTSAFNGSAPLPFRFGASTGKK